MEEKKKIRRSRNGCHNCKRLKIKCDEKKPACSYCIKTKAQCDYSIRLTWGGRPYKAKKKEPKLKSESVPATTRGESIPLNHTSVESPGQQGRLTPEIQFILHDFTTDLVKSPASPAESVSTQHEPPEYYNNKRRKISHGSSDRQEAGAIHAFTHTVSQPTFLTPHGTSILAKEDVNKQTGQHIPDFLETPLHLGDSPVQQRTPLNDIIPEISNGMDHLTNALADIGYEHFQLQNSDIFNEFIQNPDKYNKFTQLDSSSDNLERSFLNNYSEDITRIEKYLPRDLSNIFGDAVPMRLLSNFSRAPRIQELDGFDDEPTEEEYWQSIPPLLVPLPTLLLNVPFYRNLMHFWINVASHHLVPASSRIYSDNPFKILLTQMAMEYPSILNTLLAFSAKMRSNLIGKDDTPDVVIDQLLSRSCTELLRLLKNKDSATSDQTLATAMLLSCFEVFNSKDFSRHRAHNIGARQIIKARSAAVTRVRGPDAGTEKDMTFFLMRWFVYTDVIGALSSTTNSRDYLLTSGDSSTYEPLESVTMLNEIDNMRDSEIRYPKRNIDYLMGFDIKFLPQFAKITMLIREVNLLLQQSENLPSIPLNIVHKALEVKEALLETRKRDEDEVLNNHEKLIELKSKRKRLDVFDNGSPEEIRNLIQENDTLRYTNKVFCDAGLIHLYRRVLLMPRESKLVQDLAMGIGELAKTQIESRSPADICCIFCFFTTGCEVLDSNMQEYFEYRFHNLAEMGNTNARKGLEIMKRCWKTKEDWIVAAKALDLDLTLL
ncbi:hypothetical protein Cantr_00047 [Candida viswanathii]|uniref:Zn(2)-C6 fungal-type domain-containing protein n=1 Tax=Candida viswanathii TaxID=5486 RepID=A0A367YFD8_9ASCO|nr:hypothetical protein Cantr_00047 [Candida viswanathii]